MTVRFLEDLVGGLGPDEGVFAVVPPGDDLPDLRVEVFHACEGAAADCLLVDEAEPDVDKVGPRPVARSA